MPGLEEYFASHFMHSICNLSPSLRMVVVDHEWQVTPVAAGPINKSALSHNQTSSVPSSIRVVLDLGWTRLVLVQTAVACHRTHDDAISQRKLAADDDGLKKARHARDFSVFRWMEKVDK
jgi:hypothetical protein